MNFLPVFLDLKGRWAVIVGGGDVALRKASMVARAGARLRIVSPEVLPEVISLAEGSHGEVILAPFDPVHLAGAVLVVAATDVSSVNTSVHAAAMQMGIPVNVIDQPDLCSFIFPAIIDRSPLVVAVSTGGASPVLARRVRQHLESVLPMGWARLARLLADYRDAARARFSDPQSRRRFWDSLIDGVLPEAAFSGRMELARDCIEQALANGETGINGDVSLVGAGPGDPELLTFKALRLMQQADVVVYDRLVSQDILDLVRRDAQRIYVGKQRADHVIPQSEINEILVNEARAGKRVVRLKGGDPFIFGRGGEELETLAAARIPFQVVPGITAASGCACYAGIPLTHRDFAQSVRFVTGHTKDGSLDLDWPSLVSESQTLVFYMGLLSLPEICRQLMAHGMDPGMPVALIERGTTQSQRVHAATLASILAAVAEEAVSAPSLVIVGRVVSLKDRLGWFDPSR